MRRIVFTVFAGLMFVSTPAYADHGGYNDRDGRECRGGGCENDREEEYGDGSCKYFCPAFDRSPVEDSFNPTICVMPGSCTGEGRQGGGEGGRNGGSGGETPR